MTDPVDTDALRTPYDKPHSLLDRALFPSLRQAFMQGRAVAADEVDRLRARVAELEQQVDLRFEDERL